MATISKRGGKQSAFTQEELRHWLTRLTLMDDEFLETCFRGNKEGAELLLKIILGNEALRVQRVTVQKAVPNLYGRKVRLDIFAVDGEGRLYDIEVQVGGKASDLIRRARMYSALMDAGQKVKGMNYGSLRETWVIFITDDDVLGLGQPLYRIERQIVGTNHLFGDGSHIVFVNAAHRDVETPLGRLMHDLTCPDPDRMYYDVLAKTVRYHKTDEKGVRKMSGVFAAFGKEVRKRSRAEGIAIGEARGEKRGKEQNKRAVARSMLADGFAPEVIAKHSALPLSEVQAMARQQEPPVGHS